MLSQLITEILYEKMLLLQQFESAATSCQDIKQKFAATNQCLFVCCSTENLTAPPHVIVGIVINQYQKGSAAAALFRAQKTTEKENHILLLLLSHLGLYCGKFGTFSKLKSVKNMSV